MNQKKLNLVYFVVALLALAYVFVRAFAVNVTYDEAYTLRGFVTASVADIMSYKIPEANNHLLNSLLIKSLYTIGLSGVFWARVPNILAFTLYLFFAYRICLRLSSAAGVFTFLLLILNPFMLDFFGLARGYGISLGCIMAALYYVLLYPEHNYSSRYLYAAFTWMALATVASYGTLNLYLTFLLFFVLHFILAGSNRKYSNLLPPLIVTALLALVIVRPILYLRSMNRFYYGGVRGFYDDTLVSLSKFLFYQQDGTWTSNTFLNFYLLVFGLALVFSFRRKLSITDPANNLVFLLLVCALSTVMQHHLLDNLYLVGRTALLFYPLGILAFCFTLNSPGVSRFLKYPTLAIVTFILTINMFWNGNFYKTASWFFDAHTREILATANNIGKERNKKILLNYSWMLWSSMDYYAQYLNDNAYPFVSLQNKDAVPDVYVYVSGNIDQVDYNPKNDWIVGKRKDTLFEFKDEGLVVFGNIQP